MLTWMKKCTLQNTAGSNLQSIEPFVLLKLTLFEFVDSIDVLQCRLLLIKD